jgi:glutathione S-transferase
MTASPKLLLLGKSPSINVRKVLWTCAEIGIPFEQQQWGAGFQRTDVPEFRALNPNAMVPVIRDGDFVLWESNTICRYLAGKYGRSDLLPVDPVARAAVEQWMDWQAGELNNSWRYAFMALVRKSPLHVDADAIAASVASWNRHMQMLDVQIARTGVYAAGLEFTLADIVLGLSANRWRMTPIEHAACPAVDDYLARLALRPGGARYCRNGEA